MHCSRATAMRSSMRSGRAAGSRPTLSPPTSTRRGFGRCSNFGHTFGHAIETGAGYGEWLHGEAVAAGMAMAARLSVRLGVLDESVVERLCALLQRARLPVAAPRLGAERYLDLMGRDKKVVGGTLRFVLLDRLGEARVRADVTDADLAAILPR